MKSQTNDSNGKKPMRKSGNGEKTEKKKKSSWKEARGKNYIDDEFIPEVKIIFDNAKEEEMLVARLPKPPEEENVKDEVLRNVKTDNKFGSASEKGEN